ncbi:hypothetical protein [Mesorhizobium amorphae]|uniref:hypothetical protein n=1 Tax=Mesorhizobium amorphae TaxID=71433 RepID=UPI0021B39236|nr:hypothetical protein [Mesorhizobium amorphae]
MSIHPDYQQFLQAKMKVAPATGFEVDDAEINPDLAPHCRAIVRWALAGGRRAIFAAFGLHKTSIQLELMRLVGKHFGGRRLIVLPLGVRHEFFDEARERFRGEFAIALQFVRRDEEITDEDVIYIANYESVRDGKIDPRQFIAISLDEAAILRGYGTKTYQTFLPLFEGVRFKFVATATPSPNRTKELIHYAGFLQVMDTGQALTRFFQRNSEQANELTLYPHKEDEFWLWVNSWAVFLQSPADLGFSDEGYVLPAVTVNWHEVETDHAAAGVDRDGQGIMFNDPGASVIHAARESASVSPLASRRWFNCSRRGQTSIACFGITWKTSAVRSRRLCQASARSSDHKTSRPTSRMPLGSRMGTFNISPRSRRCQVPAPIFRSIVGGRSSPASTPSSTTSFKPSTGSFGSVRSGPVG